SSAWQMLPVSGKSAGRIASPFLLWEHSERVCAPDCMTDERRPIRQISGNATASFPDGNHLPRPDVILATTGQSRSMVFKYSTSGHSVRRPVRLIRVG